ncbi:MAG TPA: protein kinase, partial [Gemmataceae bacterium]|nr:protein kinase [Gemmataceae bacterium]
MSLAVNVEPRRSLLGRIRAWLRRRKTVLRAALTYPRPAADRWLPPVSTDSGGPWTCPAPPPPDPPDRSLPKRIGRFLIRKKLGEGGFGTVYLAYDPQLQRDVAVKVPRAESLSGRAIRRFLGDARAAARLRHPHIVPVFDAGFDGHVYYIASAYVNGGTLAAAIRSQAPFDSTRAARVARALADALAYAHSLGIIHRDIKPANVLLDAEGRPHLIDFGLARIVSSGEPDAAGSRAGTLHYRSPEQLCGEPVDGRSDQFSLGVVLYEMLCGRRPFAGQPDFLVDQDTVEKDPGPPSAHNPAVPADLEAICRKAMARRPEDHYADCRELADDLRRFLDGDFVAARQPGPAERLLRWCRRDPPLALAVTAVALSLAVAAVVAGTSAWRISAYAQSEAAARQDVEQERDRTAEALGRAIRSEKETKDALDQLRKKKEELEAVLQKLDGALTRVGQEKKRADEALVKVSDTLRQQEITSYFHRIALAERELRDGRLEQAETLLKECPEGLRGWEWYFLSARCGEQRRQHEGAVTCVALGGPKGKWLAWGTVTGAVVVRDLDKPRAGQRTLLRPEGKRAGAIRCLAFSPAMGKEEPELAAGDDSGRITVWKVERDGSPPTSFEAYRPPVSIRGVSFSLKGGYFATAGGQEVKVWKKDWWNPGWKPDPEYTLSHRGAVAWVGLHPLGNLVASGTSGKVFLWDRDNPGRPKVEYVSSTAGAFSPRGLDAALAMTGGAIRVYEPIRDRRGGYIEKCLYKGHNPHDVRSVVFSLGTRVASADAEGIVKVWDASSGGREFTTVRTAGGAFALSMDGQRLAWVGMDNCLHVLYVGVNTLPREKFAASGEWLDARDGDPTLAQYADYTSAVAL